MPSNIESYDVIVVGGGAAGVGAAVGAARAGARTLMIESTGCLGGAATLKCVQTYCGLYTISDKPQGHHRPRMGEVGAVAVRIVFTRGDDPVQTGLVPSINRPGGNATGVYMFNTGLSAKKLGRRHQSRLTRDTVRLHNRERKDGRH